MSRVETLAAVERMTVVLLGWTTPVIAGEIAGNADMGIQGGAEPYEASVSSLRARIACGGVGIGEVAERAQEMARAWLGNGVLPGVPPLGDPGWLAAMKRMGEV